MPRINPFLSFLFMGLLAGLGGGCAQSDDRVDFSLPDLDGKPHTLSQHRGKWVVVNYWATWCPPCLKEMPELEDFHARHEHKDAVVLGVNMEDVSVERLREFVDEYFISFPILRDRPRPRTELGTIPGLPTSFLIRPDGRLAARQVGPLTAEHLEKFIANYDN